MYREDFGRSYASQRDSEDVYSIPVRAGKRTYFFDVKATKGNNDYYLTITESKRRQERDGSFSYDKHKIFLYKEDFDKFEEGLNQVIEYIKGKIAELPNPAPSYAPPAEDEVPEAASEDVDTSAPDRGDESPKDEEFF
ncbi:MAG: PUR family DNA/RNA-binding protein [Bacteroidales bacterium]|nr:PUR family DNA/RNA-binding protein [Bacteroidales bacterium]MBQ4287516.1 PUR family DNA/RNA-binding protein [Bacteroidales bacterium]MBQ9888499.1 PUR family DNA/RNA-binding protein [Bacteroidales bacterium]